MSRSWDCFDTLLGRKYHYPKSIFNILANQYNSTNFYSARIDAEKQSGKKTLEDIYSHLPQYEMELELKTEREHTYPIIENMERVEDGDIIVSDMYLSDNQILDLLRYHGLNKDVVVYSTYGEKASGIIWERIKNKHNIEYHIGDNLHSDIKSPRNNNINAIYYGGSYLTNIEKIIERYSPYLAYWMKYIRLSNPYFVPYKQIVFYNGSISYYYGLYWLMENDGEISLLLQKNETNDRIVLEDMIENKTIILYKNQNVISTNGIHQNAEWISQPINTNRFDEHILWTEQTSYNIPLLINNSYLLPNNIVFSYRDCYYWKKIYDAIFDTNIPILESCRNSFYYPYSDHYIDYVKNLTKDKTIVDLHGTGASSTAFFNKYDINQSILFISEHCDNNKKNMNIQNFIMCFDRIFPETMESTALNHNILASKNRLKCCFGTILEKFNIPPKLGPMVGWNGSVIRQKSEHNQRICEVFDSTINTTISRCISYKDKITGNEDLTIILAKLMNKDTHTNNSIHSLWDKKRNIKL